MFNMVRHLSWGRVLSVVLLYWLVLAENATGKPRVALVGAGTLNDPFITLLEHNEGKPGSLYFSRFNTTSLETSDRVELDAYQFAEPCLGRPFNRIRDYNVYPQDMLVVENGTTYVYGRISVARGAPQDFIVAVDAEGKKITTFGNQGVLHLEAPSEFTGDRKFDISRDGKSIAIAAGHHKDNTIRVYSYTRTGNDKPFEQNLDYGLLPGRSLGRLVLMHANPRVTPFSPREKIVGVAALDGGKVGIVTTHFGDFSDTTFTVRVVAPNGRGIDASAAGGGQFTQQARPQGLPIFNSSGQAHYGFSVKIDPSANWIHIEKYGYFSTAKLQGEAAAHFERVLFGTGGDFSSSREQQTTLEMAEAIIATIYPEGGGLQRHNFGIRAIEVGESAAEQRRVIGHLSGGLFQTRRNSFCFRITDQLGMTLSKYKK